MILLTAIYGSALLVTFFVALASDSEVLIRLQLVAVGHWIAYNIVILKFGFENTGVLLVALSCFAAILSAWVGFRPRSWVAFTITGLWIAAGVLATWFYCIGAQASYTLYAGLNLTFIARMLVLGGAGVVGMVHRLGPVPVLARSRHMGR